MFSKVLADWKKLFVSFFGRSSTEESVTQTIGDYLTQNIDNKSPKILIDHLVSEGGSTKKLISGATDIVRVENMDGILYITLQERGHSREKFQLTILFLEN